MKKSTVLYTLLLTSLVIALQGCGKFLEEKSDKKLVLLDDLKNLQALLDNYLVNNRDFSSAGATSSEEYTLNGADFNRLREDYRNLYTWSGGAAFTRASVASNSWQTTYQGVYLASSVLDALNAIPRTSFNQAEWDAIKGQALALRAFRYLDATIIWAPAYDRGSAGTDLGIPLRNMADFSLPTVRPSLEETYRQILSDAEASVSLLPVTNINAYRASRPFAYALLTRVYMSMRDYNTAGLYADSCLQLYHQLADFNELSASATWPVNSQNKEIIFYAQTVAAPALNNSIAVITDSLSRLYDEHDLRKQIYLKKNADGSFRFKGNFTGGTTPFAGITVGEVYLMRAECLARAGNTVAAIADINTLLVNRYTKGTFQPQGSLERQETLNLVLTERRKELLMRGLRWFDLKRLNKEGRDIPLTRTVNGETYNLPPNDLRYALPIPDDIVDMTGIPQNIY